MILKSPAITILFAEVLVLYYRPHQLSLLGNSSQLLSLLFEIITFGEEETLSIYSPNSNYSLLISEPQSIASAYFDTSFLVSPRISYIALKEINAKLNSLKAASKSKQSL